MLRPIYPCRPLQSVESLAKALACPEGTLRSIARRVATLYIGPTPKPKKNGLGYRNVYDTKHPLKPLLKKMNQVFFEAVQYPVYLQGSIKGRDPVRNAQLHENAQVAICEDIEKFFDNITADRVFSIWSGFFGFADEPATLLTALTTNGGKVFQGTPTSSYLANLAFWDIEPAVVERLAGRGIRYSRYVDDITLSHPVGLSAEDKAWAMSQVIAMMGARGFKPARDKHVIQGGRGPITLMRMNINRQPTITAKERGQIRAMVHHLEMQFDRGDIGVEFHRAMDTVSGKVGRLQRLHPVEGDKLRERLRAVRDAVMVLPFSTVPAEPAPAWGNQADPPF
jgi:hypothetical protein